MFLYCFIKLSYCKITLKTKKQKYNFSKYNHPGIFAQKGEMLKTAELADLRRKIKRGELSSSPLFIIVS